MIMIMEEEEGIESGLLHQTTNPKSSSYSGDCSSETEQNRSSITSGVVLSTFVAVCGSLCYGCAVGYSSPSQSGIMNEMELSIASYSVFGSIMTFGGMIGAIFSGKLSALIGRKRTMWFSEIFCTFGWLAIAFAKDPWWLDIGRLSLGFGVGFISYVVPIYIAEIAPKDSRGGFTFANQLMQNCGFSLVYLTGNVLHWRYVALISAIPCLIQFVGLFFIPESPRWLANAGKEKEFESTLQWLRGKEADISEEAYEIKDVMESYRKDSINAGMMDLFQKKYAHSIIVGVGLMLLQQLGGSSGMTYYASNIIEESEFSSSIGTTILAIAMVFYLSATYREFSYVEILKFIYLIFPQVPKALIVLLFVDKWGRRPLLMISCIGMCLCCFLLGLSFFLQTLNQLQEWTSFFAFVAVLGYVTSFAIGMGGLPWVIMSEIFPVNIKVSAGTVVTVAFWFFSWIVVYTFNFMLEWNSAGTFFIFSAICGATIIFIWTLVPETKGKTLEEIQISFSQF